MMRAILFFSEPFFVFPLDKPKKIGKLDTSQWESKEER